MRFASQNLEGTLDEVRAKRFSNVGFLSIKALEQTIEACAAKEGLHFHDHPRSAHKGRRDWVRTNHPDLLKAWDELWIIYGILGYAGTDGKRAEMAVKTLKKTISELARREGIRVSEL